MSGPTSPPLFHQLRKQHPSLVYHSHEIRLEKSTVSMIWNFELTPGIFFYPGMTFKLPEIMTSAVADQDSLEHLAFHIGMIELISYYKAACPVEIIIRPYALPPDAITFWKHIYFLGLGEFRYLNHIQEEVDNLFTLVNEGSPLPELKGQVDMGRLLVPVGGGKDSAVSLWLLSRYHKDYELMPFMVNPWPSSLRTLDVLGIPRQGAFTVSRKLDTKLLELNSKGYLNGHTPFSALLAFTAHGAALMQGAGHIVLSNESSANEATIPGTDINHQYSKSIDFEQRFRNYLKQVSRSPVNYFSLLRPLNELQIASIFSKMTAVHPVFRSCNAGSKTDSWCGKCPKCLFTAVMLAPYLDDGPLLQIFGKDILSDSSMQVYLDELGGWAEAKPFECIGTVDEVRQALYLARKRRNFNDLPFLLDYAGKWLTQDEGTYTTHHLKTFDRKHFVPAEFMDRLQDVMCQSIPGARR